jgi:hypothetical protein
VVIARLNKRAKTNRKERMSRSTHPIFNFFVALEVPGVTLSLQALILLAEQAIARREIRVF